MTTGAVYFVYILGSIFCKHTIQKNSQDSMRGLNPPVPPLGTPVVRPFLQARLSAWKKNYWLTHLKFTTRATTPSNENKTKKTESRH